MATPCSNNPDEVIEKIVSAKANADKFDRFVNGTDTQTIQLGTGAPTPTIRNVVRQVMADASWAKQFIANAPEGDVSLNNVTALLSIEPRTLAERFSDIVNVKDFGAKGDGVTDDTEAFVSACSTHGFILVPNGTYVVSGTIPVHGHVIGSRAGSTINLYLNGEYDKGFDMYSNSSISGLKINRYARDEEGFSYLDGFSGNAISVGVRYTYEDEVYTDYPDALTQNVSIKDITIVGYGKKWNTIAVRGNTENFIIENIDVSGTFLICCLMHWKQKQENGVITTYHPRKGVIRNFHASAESSTLGDSGIPYISACHDIVLENVSCRNTAKGLTIAAGTYGGQFASGESKGKVLSNILVSNISIYNPSAYGLQINGASDFISSVGNRWFMTDTPSTSVSIRNYHFEGASATNSSTEPIFISFANNVLFDNINIGMEEGYEDDSNNWWACESHASSNIRMSGRMNFGRGFRFYEGQNINLYDMDITKNEFVSEASSSDFATALYGNIATASVSGSVVQGGTSVTLASVPCRIVPGTKFICNDVVGYFTGSADANDTNVAISIEPARSAIASGSSMSIYYGIDGFYMNNCHVERFLQALTISGVSGSEHPKNICIDNCNFDLSHSHHIALTYAQNVAVTNCVFNRGNFGENVSSAADVNVSTGCKDIRIIGNSFNKNYDTDIIYCVYVLNGAEGVVITGNNFMKHNNNTTTHSTSCAVYLNDSGSYNIPDNIVGLNYFGSGIINKVLPASKRKTIYLGSNTISYATSAPASGSWERGDIVFNANAAASGAAGWVCVAAGTPGTWKTFATISS